MTDSTSSRLEVPLLALIKRADPTFFKDRARIIEYEMANGREFTADPTTRGAYGAPNSGPRGGGYADYTGPVGADDFFNDSTPDVFDPAASANTPNIFQEATPNAFAEATPNAFQD